MSYAAAFTRTAKRQAKVALAGGLIAAGQVGRSRRARDLNLAVLMYHGVLPHVRGPSAYGDLFVSARDFKRHLKLLKAQYQPMSLPEVVHAIDSGTPFPPRAVAVTFDDGYENTVKVALPLLAEAGIPATVFVPSQLIGGSRYLWFDCLRLLVQRAGEQRKAFELGASVAVRSTPPRLQEHHFLSLSSDILELPVAPRGRVLAEIERVADRERLLERFPEFALTTWPELTKAVAGGILTVGSHALAHGDLSVMSREEQATDLRAAREQIERCVGQPCTSIAYPYGRWNGDTLAAAREAGYRCALTVENGFNVVGDNQWRLKRIMVGDKGHRSILSARLSGSWDSLRIRS